MCCRTAKKRKRKWITTLPVNRNVQDSTERYQCVVISSVLMEPNLSFFLTYCIVLYFMVYLGVCVLVFVIWVYVFVRLYVCILCELSTQYVICMQLCVLLCQQQFSLMPQFSLTAGNIVVLGGGKEKDRGDEKGWEREGGQESRYGGGLQMCADFPHW